MSNSTNPTDFCILMLAGTTEFLVNLVAIPVSTLNFVLVFRASVIHPNLKFILLFQSCFILMRGMCRFIICIYKFAWFDPITPDTFMMNGGTLAFFYGVGIYTRNFVVHILIIERIMATVMVKTYETKRRRWFTLIWSPIVIFLGLYNTVVPMVKNTSETYLNLITTTALLALGLLEFGIFYGLWRYNAKRYKQKSGLLAQNSHSLSERYQLSENIRIGKQLSPALLLHLFNIFTGAIILYWGYLALPGIAFVFTFVANSNSLCGLLIEYSMIAKRSDYGKPIGDAIDALIKLACIGPLAFGTMCATAVNEWHKAKNSTNSVAKGLTIGAGKSLAAGAAVAVGSDALINAYKRYQSRKKSNKWQ